MCLDVEGGRPTGLQALTRKAAGGEDGVGEAGLGRMC